MRNTSRVILYKWVREHINNNDYINDKDQVSTLMRTNSRIIEDLLNLNIAILEGVEERFLTNEDRDLQWEQRPLEEIIKERRNILSAYMPEKKIDEFYKKMKKNDNSIFNSLLNVLNDISKERLKNFKLEKVAHDTDSDSHQVFLSYAFEDRLYTLCLYMYFLSQGVTLYVDWLYCDALPTGIDIKDNLTNELSNSKQFLFFRSANSELHIQGNVEIKGWCSWEMGTFYTLNNINQDEKYYIGLYDEKEIDPKSQLNGFRKLTGINHGVLV